MATEQIIKEEKLSLFDLPSWIFDHTWEEKEIENSNLTTLNSTIEEENLYSAVALQFIKRLINSPLKTNDDSIFSPERYYHPGFYFIQMKQKLIADAPEVEKSKLPIEKLQSYKTIAVLLCHGGYFSGAIFEKKRVIAHKSFHHYVTRRKQGGRQSTRDKSGRRPQSGGANIRRYNEEKHENEIRKLMLQWKMYWNEVDLIFVNFPGRNRDEFIQDGELKEGNTFITNSKGEIFFHKNDDRIRTIPFTTRRANFAHVREVFTDLTTVTMVTVTQNVPVDDNSLPSIPLRQSIDESTKTILPHSLRSSVEFVDISDVELDEDEEAGEEGDEQEEDEESENLEDQVD